MAPQDRLTPEELARLLAAADLSRPTGIRNAAMMALMVTGGLKVGELVGKEIAAGDGEEPKWAQGGLRLTDIDWAGRHLTVRRPGDGRSRTIALAHGAFQLLKAWVELRPRCDSDLVFVTRRGTRILNRYVRRFLSEYGQAAGIERSVKPSMLRRTFGARLFERTGDLQSVAETLGLRHLASSLRYVEPAADVHPESEASTGGGD